ncbi:hypothetical protein [Yersinia alsatica]|uniref:hypothetical protein n=1 Tax=Yersinia alsatica TaxID=2890317 RepID=UPI0011A104ED|nr:hypothetical protein [Yersinia alsatica]
MINKVAQDLTQEIAESTGVDFDTAALVAMDFLALDIFKHNHSSREIEEAFMSCHKPGFDAYSFRIFLRDRYSLTDKQSSVIANGFRYKCDSQRNINKVITLGISDATWTFRSSCIWKDSHQPLDDQGFNLETGIAMSGRFMAKPGEPWLCACDFRIVIPEQKTPKTSTLNKLFQFIKRIFNKKSSQQARLSIETRTITKNKARDKNPT